MVREGGFETLHLHTTTSDGKMNHTEALRVAARNKVRVIAFTDHDAIPKAKDVAELKTYFRDHSTAWMMGIEVSSGLPRELGGGAYSGLHVVGLGVNPYDARLGQYCDLSQKARVERMERMVKNLRNLGFEITEQDCLDSSGGESVARPHIVAALNLDGNENNAKVFTGLIEDMKKNNPDQYANMVGKGRQSYPYELFLGDKAYTPGVYVDYLYVKELDESIGLIRGAGGVAVIAHYWTARKKIGDDFLEKLFEERRLDGIETVFGLDEYLSGSSVLNQVVDARMTAHRLADAYGKLKTGGADIHTEKQLVDFSNNVWYAKQTIGMAQSVVERLGKNDWHTVK